MKNILIALLLVAGTAFAADTDDEFPGVADSPYGDKPAIEWSSIKVDHVTVLPDDFKLHMRKFETTSHTVIKYVDQESKVVCFLPYSHSKGFTGISCIPQKDLK